MKSHKESDQALLYSIRSECSIILSRVRGKLLPDFVEDSNLQDAVVMHLVVIGETAKKLSSHAKHKFSGLNWSGMVRFRDKATHHYEKIDFLQVWEIVQEHIPVLYDALSGIEYQG
jgi:uncharacterized protein with HEPN domain